MVHPVYSLHRPLSDRLTMWWKCLSLTTSLISKHLCYVSLSRLHQRFTKHMKQRTTSSTQYLQLTLCSLNGLKVYCHTACLKQSRMTLMMLSADSGETMSTESCSFFSSHWQLPCFYLAAAVWGPQGWLHLYLGLKYSRWYSVWFWYFWSSFWSCSGLTWPFEKLCNVFYEAFYCDSNLVLITINIIWPISTSSAVFWWLSGAVKKLLTRSLTHSQMCVHEE